MRQVVLTWTVALTLALPAVCSAQIYVGAAVGAGGASLPPGSYGSGFRGMARLFGGYAFTPNVAAEAMTFDLGTPRRSGDETTLAHLPWLPSARCQCSVGGSSGVSV